MADRVARITVTETGETCIHMPDGRVRYYDSMIEAARVALDLDVDGVLVLLADGEPAFPKSGLIGLLDRGINWLERKRKSRIKA